MPLGLVRSSAGRLPLGVPLPVWVAGALASLAEPPVDAAREPRA